MTRVMAAMSGGVDSSVAVHLLANRDAVELEGAYIRTWQHEENFFGDCPAGQEMRCSGSRKFSWRAIPGG